MKEKYMEKLVGRYCKIVTKEPGEERASVITGILRDVDYEDGFIMVDSEQGLGCLSISTIIAIKPGTKRKNKNIIKNEEAVVGIGTLIVFIAMILVAAVAATIIIQTSENLQNRAYAVAKQTIHEVSSGIKIIDITGYTDSNKTKIEYLAISISPRAGSYDLDLNETLVYLEYDNLTVLSLAYQNFTDNGELYNGHQNGSISGSVSSEGIFHTLNLSCLTSTNYGVIAIRDADSSIVNSFGLGTNDMCLILINLSAAFPETGGLEPGEQFSGRIVPAEGSAGIFVVSAPNAFHHRVVDL